MKDTNLDGEVHEVTLKEREDHRSDLNVKSTNYLMRTYMATDTRSKDGYAGIEQDREGFLLEASMATVAVLLRNGDFIIPPFDRIVPGTTAIKILRFIEEEVIPKKLLGEDYMKRTIRREIKVKEA
jgi:branched-subunit amino acid aminotransferase/4-amino-4-deoxychorismate lyase